MPKNSNQLTPAQPNINWQPYKNFFRNATKLNHSIAINIFQNNQKLQDLCSGEEITIINSMGNFERLKLSLAQRILLFKKVLTSRKQLLIDEIWQRNPDLRQVVTEYNQTHQKQFLFHVFRSSNATFIKKYLKSISKKSFYNDLILDCYLKSKSNQIKRILKQELSNLKIEIPENSLTLSSSLRKPESFIQFYQMFYALLSYESRISATQIWNSSLELRKYCCGEKITIASHAEVETHQLPIANQLSLFKRILKTQRNLLINPFWQESSAIKNWCLTENAETRLQTLKMRVKLFEKILLSRNKIVISNFWSANPELQENILNYSEDEQFAFVRKIFSSNNWPFIRMYLSKLSSKDFHHSLLTRCYNSTKNRQLKKSLGTILQEGSQKKLLKTKYNKASSAIISSNFFSNNNPSDLLVSSAPSNQKFTLPEPNNFDYQSSVDPELSTSWPAKTNEALSTTKVPQSKSFALSSDELLKQYEQWQYQQTADSVLSLDNNPSDLLVSSSPSNQKFTLPEPNSSIHPSLIEPELLMPWPDKTNELLNTITEPQLEIPHLSSDPLSNPYNLWQYQQTADSVLSLNNNNPEDLLISSAPSNQKLALQLTFRTNVGGFCN